MSKSKISVLMSVYNDAQYIRGAIESVLKQSFHNWEFIIMDDASIDDTSNIIRDYTKKDKRLKYYKFQTNKGVPTCLNRGIKLSCGDFIARIDSDDLWLDSHKLQKQINFVEDHPDCGLVGTWTKVIDENDKDLYDLKYPTDDSIIRVQMLKHNCFISSSVLIRKKIAIKVGLYGITSRPAEDYGLWLKLGTVSQLFNIPEYMTGYRINPSGISQSTYKEQIHTSLRVIKENMKFYPHYNEAFILWNLRKYYPKWLRGSLSRKLNPIK